LVPGGSGGTLDGGPSSAGSGGTGGTSKQPSTGGRDADGGGGGEDTVDAGAGGEAGAPDPGPECDLVPVGSEPFTKRGLLEAAAACAARQYCLFEHDAEALHERASAAAADPSDEIGNAARAAWFAAMATWEEAEVFQFGPAALVAEPGGRALRNLVYSWPLDARCQVDTQTVSKFYEKPAFLGSANASITSGRSLRALEYLLFYGGTDNGCTQYSSINSTGSWNQLGLDEVRSRKRAYAARAALDVLAQSRALVLAWSPDGDDFRAKLVEPGPVYANEQAALNAVGGALFYVDDELKDGKLAIPLGLDMVCPYERCPDLVEARFALSSVDHVARNLRGFRKLFQGCAEGNAGVGFDDWLVAVGAGELSTRMLEALDGVEAAVASLDQPLEALIVNDPARVQAFYDALKRLTDPLKTEFVTVLNLERPAGSIGDND
jgi:predicted lipoprotein